MGNLNKNVVIDNVKNKFKGLLENLKVVRQKKITLVIFLIEALILLNRNHFGSKSLYYRRLLL